ncbi:MAG TPA: Clp protease N-terminal domain-containing protein [Candidatus Angelobacter sp.]|nr:Clp protease N-terminal domain-containing protein [Candidatus Angelobacter sp.]
MFERYTESARRAVYFARTIAVLNDATRISSTNLLQGMLWEDSSRAQTIFHLQNNFPVSRGRPWKRQDANIAGNGPGLTGTSKKILAWTAKEADHLGDYWIDVEHLLLGIMCEHSSAAARCVAQTGLTIKVARKTIKDNKPSRPQYGPVPLWWQVKTQPLKLIFRWLHYKR